jgi:tRNA wybutosine-synthesizing protein 2
MRNSAIDLFSRKTGIPKEEISNRYEIIGKSMVIRIPQQFYDEKRLLAKALLSSFKLWSVYEYSGIEGKMRVPKLNLLAGIGTDVVHSENGIKYKLDPSKIMFSKGNKNERHRLVGLVGKGETVLDMFAGIGYFSLPISFKALKVIACEINPEAFHYLLLNKTLNKANNVIPVLGDSAKLEFREIADRILMGHFDSMIYFRQALTYLKRKGIVHMHLLVKRGDEDGYRETLAREEDVSSVEMHRVKGYSPKMDHIVFDVEVQKK